MQRTLVLVALLFAVVLGLVAWWASRRLGELEADNARVASAIAGEERAKAELEPLDARAGAADPVVARVAPNTDDIATVATPTEAGLELLVVAKDGGAPIAGASVHAQSFARLGFSDRTRAPATDLDTEELLASAPEYVTDAHGRVVLPRHLRPSSVCARKGDLYGARTLGRDEPSPMKLELANDRVLLVRVIDGNARPVAGVPVGLHGAVETEPEPFWTAATRADGVARIAHVDALLKQRREAGPFRVRLEILAREGELGVLTLDPAALPTEPVELVLPPCGSVDVRYFGPGGETVHAAGVSLADAAVLDEHGAVPWSAPVHDPAVLEPSHAFYPFVGTGLELYVALLGGGVGQEHKRFQGPMNDGERVTVDLEVEDVLAGVVFRVLRPDRRPFASLTLQVSAFGPLGTISSPRTTDAEGRVRAPVPALASNATDARLWLSSADDDGAPLSAFVSLPSKLERCEHDLGDVVLQRPTELARVHVVDDTGRGIADANVKARVRGLDGGYRVDVDAHEDGWFDVRGGLVGVPMDVFASKSGHANAARVEFTPPTGALVITLPRASTVSGRALVDDDQRGQLKVLLRYRDPLPPEIAAAEGARSTFVGATGEFRLEDVRPGRVDLEFRSSSDPAFRVVLEDVLLLPGERATDGRLETLDLRRATPRTKPR